MPHTHPAHQGATLQPVKRGPFLVALLAAPVTSAPEVTFESALAEFFAATEVSDREKAARRLLVQLSQWAGGSP